MTVPQLSIFVILIATVGLFLWGRFRHDVVALAALMACVLAGLVPAADAFSGFGHPAVITVACVLVLSAGLQTTGAVDAMARKVLPRKAGRLASLSALMGLGALLSGFMNNVGAMALLMPIGVQLSGRLGLTQGQVLMPLAFGTILGGMTTLVGTPPNLIVASFRTGAGMRPFGMFDFAWVGLPVAAIGVAFVVVLGWRLVPARKAGGGVGFDTAAYMTEARVPEKSKSIGVTLRQFEDSISGADVQILALVRDGQRLNAPHGGYRIRAGDLLVLMTDVEGLAEALSVFGIKLEEQVSVTEKNAVVAANNSAASEAKTATAQATDEAGGSEESSADQEIELREFAVLPMSTIVGRSARDLRLRTRYGLNLLAVSREGTRSQARLRALRLKPGDLLLMQGSGEALVDFAAESGCVPLGERRLRIPDRRLAFLATTILLVSVASVTLGLLPAAVAFTMGVLASMVLGTVPLRKVYSVIDWPVVVLLAALIPVAGAMQQTGAAGVLAQFLVATVARGSPIAALVVILLTTMFLSDVMNNAATAAVMSPIALGIAAALNVNADGFLMAVAIGASCAFLTPIGHQNNTLILGPGGFRFGDYWRLGLPLEALVVVVSVPLILIFWSI
ncbi:SLC13 family permease [Phaeovulum sp.]|uniref:SLC13 family permease n=1 Tax=Phaeovulum sp. TaxID=2934796 RepID=UPI0039E2581E